MLSLDTKIDNYISTNNNANLDLTFGKLPTRLHVLFNHYTDFDKNFNANVHKAPGFVLQGNSRCIKHNDENLCSGKDLSTERGFYSVILQYTDRTFNELITHLSNYLKDNKEVISFLNQGKIYAKFKTIVEKKYLGAKQYKNVSINTDHIIKEFIKFLEDPDYDTVDFDKKYIIDLISRPGVIHRDGLNIVLFKQTPHKLPSNNINLGKMFIKCLDDIFIEDYYNDDKKFIFIYEYPDRSYESIVYKKPSKGKLDLVHFFDPKDNNLSELMEIMKEWYLKSCTQQYTSRAISTKNWNILTAKQTVQLLENVAKYDSKYTPKKIIYDPISQRSIYIVTINDYIIPVKQSIYSNEKYKKITNITKYESSYKDTLKYLEKLNTIIDNNSEFKKIDTYENAGVYIKNNKATHLVLLNDRYIPIKKMKFTTVSEKNNETIIKLEDGTKTKISNIKIYNKINDIVIAGNEWDNIRDIIVSIRIQEIYNRTILELAELLDNTRNKKIKAHIIKLIKNSHNKQSKIEEYKTHESYNIKRQLYRIVEKLVKNKLSTTMGEDRSNRYSEKYHIRQTCKTIEENAKRNGIGGCDDNFCIPTLGGCKLYIPEDKLKLFVGMLVSELLTYGKRKWNENKNKFDIIISGRIIDNSVSPIVDIDVFESHDDIIYERKTDLGNLLQNIKLHKEMS